MKIKILYALTGIFFLIGCGILTAATSAIHEIEALLAFVVTAILLMGTLTIKSLDAWLEE